MYTKIGLSALVIVGLTLGAVGMLTSAGGASPAGCIAPSNGVSAPASAGNNGSSATVPLPNTNGNKRKATTNKKKTSTPAKQPGGVANPVANMPSTQPSSGSGSGGNGDLLDVNGRTNAPSAGINATVPGDGSAPSAGSGSGATSSTTPPFLDLLGSTNTTNVGGGTVPAPPTSTHVVGRSQYLGSLLTLTGRGNAGS